MITSNLIQNVLNSTIHSLQNVLPLNFNVSTPTVVHQPYQQKELSVLVSLLGDVKGRLIIDTTSDVIGKVGQKMFGIPLENEMIESFAGELGNMIAGNLSTNLAQNTVQVDISTPTIMKGAAMFYGFKHAITLPIHLDPGDHLQVLLIIDEPSL